MKRKSKPDPQPFIGTYRLGLYNVEVYGLTDESGGYFYNAPDDKAPPRIKVGFAYDHWAEVVSVLMHEAFEFLAVQRGVRLRPCGMHPTSSDVFKFYFDHNEFTTIIDDLAYFSTKVLPDLATAYKTARRKKR